MMTAQQNPWLVRFKENPQATVRLICFPYAGGAANIYHKWAGLLPAWIELCAVQPPGRGSRLLEEPFTDARSLVCAASEALTPYLDRPFALFGHSLGALVAFEFARHLRRQGKPGPICMFVSGRCAPQIPETGMPLHTLPEPQFLVELQRLNGTPDEVLAHPDLMKLMIPVLRGDFAVAETYQYLKEPPLDCRIKAFGGLDDMAINRRSLEAWKEQTANAFSLHMLPGDHFFLFTSEAYLLDLLSEQMAASC